MASRRRLGLAAAIVCSLATPLAAQQTQKPPLHARHWLAITGKPLGATAGALMYAKGGNAVDAACAMLGAVTTMWDVLSWGGETQALIYNPKTRKVIGIDALGVAPAGATAEFYRSKGYRYPPEYGPARGGDAGNAGRPDDDARGVWHAVVGEVLAPAIQMAEGYPIEAETADAIESEKGEIKKWKYSPRVFLPHAGQAREAPAAGEVFVQSDLAATLRKLVEAERLALKAGKSRKAAIYAAYDRFYKGDIATSWCAEYRRRAGSSPSATSPRGRCASRSRSARRTRGSPFTSFRSGSRAPRCSRRSTSWRTSDVKAMGYNSPKYIHTLYQAMNLAFADRDFYYGDPYFPPEEPVKGLLSKEYAKSRYAQIDWTRNDSTVKPGDPYPFQGGTNPFTSLLAGWTAVPALDSMKKMGISDSAFRVQFYAGTTSIEAADEEGWVVSVTPSGGWIPAVIAGRTGVGLSQRAQSFVTRAEDGPYNVIEPGKRPRVTLTPTLAMKEDKPFLAFAVQGGDSQDQNLLQWFLDIVEFGMTPQQAAEAPNINSDQMRSSFGEHESRPGRLLVASSTPDSVRAALKEMGYTLEFRDRTSGPINGIMFDRAHGTMWGASSNHGEDYGIAW